MIESQTRQQIIIIAELSLSTARKTISVPLYIAHIDIIVNMHKLQSEWQQNESSSIFAHVDLRNKLTMQYSFVS